MRFTINHPKFQCHIDITDKYAFVLGASGKGKSFIFQILQEIFQTRRDLLQYDGDIHIIHDAMMVKDIPRYVEESPGCLIIVDEMYAGATLATARKLDCCVLAITRKDPAHIKHSYRSVFKASRVEGVTYLKPQYVRLPKVTSTVLEYDTLITEDSGAGYKFFKHWCGGNVVPASSKNNVHKKLTGHVIGPNIVVMVDAGGCCDCLIDISNATQKLIKVGYRVTLILPESFEEILLNASFIDFDGDLLSVYTYVDESTEALAERLLEEKTRDTPFAYTHDDGFLTDCWVKDCKQCCTSPISGNRYSSVAHGKFAFLNNLKPTVEEVVNKWGCPLQEAVKWCAAHPYSWLVTTRFVSELRELGVRLDRRRVFKYGDMYAYASFHCAEDIVYVKMSLVQLGDTLFIPRGVSYAAFKDVSVLEIT